MILYRANILFTPSPVRFDVVERGYVAVDDAGIVQGVYDRLPAGWEELPVVDYGDRLLIPAMNDMHVHAPQYTNIGIAMDMPLLPWLTTYIFPEEERFDDMEYAAQRYAAFVEDLCRQGTMRAAIFATSHPAATRLLAQQLADKGMGGAIGLVGMDRHVPESLQQGAAAWREAQEQLVDDCAAYAKVFPIITPRFIPTCSPAMLQQMGAMAQRTGMAVQSHLSENKQEVAWVQSLEPQSSCYGDAYYRYGLFGQTPTLMAHCCYTEGEELQLMREQGVWAVHCPTSNCNLASGIAPIRRFLQEGLTVVLGSDVAGGHHLSMMRVMQYAVQMSKIVYAQTDGKYPFLSLSEVFYMATKGGGAFFGAVGSFEKGYAFDALVIDDRALCGVTCDYDLMKRLERFIYLGDDRHIVQRYCQGQVISLQD